MTKANHLHALVNQTADIDSESDDSDTDNELMLFAMMAKTSHTMEADNGGDIVVRAHLEYDEVYKRDNKVYAISDGGADSVVLGKHAHVINQTGCFATLVGYDPKTTRSNRIPIVSAYLKVKAHNDIPVFLKVNEAVYHQDNPITLLSEYQIREYGYVIDSVATKHKRSSTEAGTQRLALSEYVHIPFEDRGGIMGFEILPITDDDFKDDEPLYDVFEVTGAKAWKPARFRQDPEISVDEQQALVQEATQAPTQEDCDGIKEAKVDDSNELVDHSENLYYFDPTDELLTPDFEPAFLEFNANHILSTEVPNETIPWDQETGAINAFLSNLSYSEITGSEKTVPEYYGYPPLPEEGEQHDTFDSYAHAVASWHRILHDQLDPEKVTLYLAYQPLEVVRNTLKYTTQLAKMII